LPFKVNFNTMGKPVPGSIYGAKVDSYKVDDENNKAHIVFRITDEGDYTGKKLLKFYQTDGDAGLYLFNDLVTMGADPEEMAPPPTPEYPAGQEIDIEPFIQSVVGTSVLLKVSIRTYVDKNTGKDKESNNIDEIQRVA
jgi:hypothetical protein